MIDETVKRFIKMMMFLARRAHQEARRLKFVGPHHFNKGKSGAYLVAAKVAREYQRQDKKKED